MSALVLVAEGIAVIAGTGDGLDGHVLLVFCSAFNLRFAAAQADGSKCLTQIAGIH